MLKKLSRNMKDIKKIEIKLIEVKITMCEMNNMVDWINGRVDNVEEKISKLECRAIKIIQKEKKRERIKYFY